jgi:hypothetical protein
MLSIHAVRAIKAQRLEDADWIELTFEGYNDESIAICIYAWAGSADPTWPSRFTKALAAAIEALPPTPPPASFIEESLHTVEED